MENDKNKGTVRPAEQTGVPKNAPDTPHVTPVENALNLPTVPIEGPVGTGEIDEQAPAKEAIEEKNDRPAANTIMWAIIIAIVVMLIIYFMVFHDRDVVSSVP